jgi:integrating conjugative element protein (TIGR03752 family)
MALVLVFVGIKLFSGERGAKPAPPARQQLTPEEMKALGIEGDTPRDTVATLVAQVKQLRNELQTALNDNKNQKPRTSACARESAIDQRIQSALDGERGRLQQDREQVASDRQQTQGLLQDLQRRLDGLSGKGGQADLPVGLGWRTATARASAAPGGARAAAARAGWSRTMRSRRRTAAAAAELPDQLRAGAEDAFDTPPNGGRRRMQAAARGRPKPVYTVPSNSTLMGSIAMTALIGRVPIDGTVNDPYPSRC